jgi:Zn-dependent protease/CBS domain-containing protein
MKMVARQFEVINFKGIPIRLDYSWFVIFLIYTWVIAKVYLPAMAPGMSSALCWLFGLITVLLLFVSVLGHEMAHSIVARRQGIGIKGITLHIFGGLSHLEREPSTPMAEFKIAVAGPAVSLLFGLIFYALAEVLTRNTDYVGMSKALLHLGVVNVLLAGFNLLPGFPMDGGRILRAIIWHRRKSYEAATHMSLKMGAAIAVSLICVGVLTLFVQHDWLTGLWSIATGLLLVRLLHNMGPEVIRSIKNGKRTEQERVGTVAEVMTKTVAAVRPEMPVSEFLEEVFARRAYTTFPVVQDDRLHGILLAADARKLPKELHNRTSVRELMQPVMAGHFVARDLPLEEAAICLAANGFGHAAVLDNEGFVVGYLSLKDLQHFSGRA